MNEFVEECRSEWKRLGVLDPVADEMAADLAADLQEAEAEGASAEDVLGTGAFDARSFATAWAAERGVIQRPPPSGNGLPRRSRGPAAIVGAFALVAIIGAVLVILASPSAPGRLALASPVALSPDGRTLAVLVDPPPRPASFVRVAPPPLPGGDARTVVAVGIDDSGVDIRTVAWVLLTVGLAGLVPWTMFWLWVRPGRWSVARTWTTVRAGSPVNRDSADTSRRAAGIRPPTR